MKLGVDHCAFDETGGSVEGIEWRGRGEGGDE